MTTADGRHLVPGMTVWAMEGGDVWQYEIVRVHSDGTLLVDSERCADSLLATTVYSTRDAAISARLSWLIGELVRVVALGEPQYGRAQEIERAVNAECDMEVSECVSP